MIHRLTRVALLLISLSLAAAERKPIHPAGVKPVGPYTPGVQSGDFLYVSGQGARDAQAQLPATFEAQVTQTLNNVKAIVEAAGLKMENIVYTQVYLSDMSKYAAMNKAYAAFFPREAPARAVIGVTRMPTDTPVEINAIAVRDLKLRQQLKLPAPAVAGAPISYGVQVGNRFYLGGLVGREAKNEVPKDARAQVELMMKRAQSVLKAANLELRHLAAANVYVDSAMPFELLVKVLEELIPDETATTVVQVASLPLGAHIEITGVASRDFKREGKCTSVSDTVYCGARAGTIDQVMKELQGDLESARAGLRNVVASNVYIDHLDNFNAMNKTYASFFKEIPPARTTVQAANNPATLALTPATGSEPVVQGPKVQVSVTAVR